MGSPRTTVASEVVPDLVAEVSSPSTRALDLGRKRYLYERHGVSEYWFIDLDADQVVVHRLQGGRYETTTVGKGSALESRLFPDRSIPVDDLLAGRD